MMLNAPSIFSGGIQGHSVIQGQYYCRRNRIFSNKRMHIPYSGIVSHHPCADEITPERIELDLVRGFIKSTAAIWNAFRQNLFNGYHCKNIHHSISPYQHADEVFRNMKIDQLSFDRLLPVKQAPHCHSSGKLSLHGRHNPMLEIRCVRCRLHFPLTRRNARLQCMPVGQFLFVL